ncbi:GDP-6-deoxy-D-mannose reductase [Caulifigura coniformis]|uniref:GDP-6-deoxy-D-mannose reductase n=1 Tax=Caulifigura coniformis TaxID=2527983 RepID=A0A517SIA2_9PLAN|nr:NAD(P)-dependent oxidoreductase [Caulifigura coniformis]QDT55847.1 GDP-6-deoxy-D-mannose reductase [Caulifigura coniformis]
MSLAEDQPLGTTLLTGASGFLGTWIEKHLRERGTTVVRAPKASAAYSGSNGTGRAQFLGELASLLKETRPTCVVHAAGSASVPKSFADPECDFFGNVVLSQDLVNAVADDAPEAKLLLISSAAVYGQPETLPVGELCSLSPLSPYGLNKQLAETIVQNAARARGLRTAIVRVFSAYGDGLRKQVVWDIMEKAHRGPVIRLQGTGSESRDFIHASDVARAVEAVVTNGQMQGEAYNVASGEETTIATLAGLLVRELPSPIDVQFDGKIPSGTPCRWQADIGLVRSLGFRPAVPLEEGVKQFVRWYRSAAVHV